MSPKVWESAAPPTHIWKRYPQKKRFFFGSFPYGPWELKKKKQGQDDHFWVENWIYTLHWEQPWRRNDKGPLSEDVGGLVQ